MNNTENNCNGYLLIDKPAGVSSFGIVSRVRRELSHVAGKKVKVGHTGTLDPFATGLLIIVVGDWCKRAGEFNNMDKEYKFTATLGLRSSTGDPEGELAKVSDLMPGKQDIERILPRFRGSIMQTPPVYSAIKINGQRAYKLARSGQPVNMPSRQVYISDLKLLEYHYPQADFEAAVSSGTYIRSLVEDIGAATGAGAYCSSLRRTRVGQYKVEEAIGEQGFGGLNNQLRRQL